MSNTHSRHQRQHRHGPSLRAIIGTLLLACLPMLAWGCTDRQPTTGEGPLPVLPTAFPKTDSGAVAKSPPQDIQELRITVADGRFDSDRYSAQSSPARLIVTTVDGPYTLSIDPLLGPTELPAGGTTEIGLTLPNPGDYTMRLSGGGDATAVLNVRPLGER